jgi:hypothetical protein
MAAGAALVWTAAFSFCSPHPSARNATIADAAIINVLTPAPSVFIALLPAGFGLAIIGRCRPHR